MEELLKGLNNAQRDAVTSPSSILQVLAPPGSGKTKTLTARVAYLLTHNGYAPWDIICCTFTIKAAREMRERLRGLIGEGLESKLILGTFHSICRRYLAKYGNKIGILGGFGIADSTDSLAIVKRIIKRSGYNIDASTARSRISRCKARGLSYDDETPGRKGSKQSVSRQEFRQVYRDYEQELAKSNLLDYDDLLLRCLELLREHPECVSNVQAVLIDEFQDTNTVQFELMKLFASKNNRITIVGDPDQSIYSFRAAEIANLLRMRGVYTDTTVIHLEENYRSCAAILSSAQDVIEQDTARPNKRLKATHGHGSMPTFRKLPSAYAEASWIVTEIQRAIALTGKMLNFSDFAILLRSAALSRLIESAMGKSGIPYRMVGGFRFFDRVEVRVLLDYLRTVCQPQNNDALLAIINVPPRGLGEKTVKSLIDESDTLKVSLFGYIKGIVQGTRESKNKLRTQAEHSLSTLVDLLLKAREKLAVCEPKEAPKALLKFLIEDLRYKDYLEKTLKDDEETRWTNVEELLAQADNIGDPTVSTESEDLPMIEGVEQQIQNEAEETLSRFLANIALSSEVQSDDDGQQQRITISTIHAAKGLEWPVVFIPAVYEGSIPHSRAEDTDEERRLLYVAMTRAQALLYLSHPRKGSRLDEETTCSHFIRSESLSRYFQDSGPIFNDRVLKSAALVLRRDMPSDAIIIEETPKLKSIHDDLWPLTGESGDEEQKRWTEVGGQGPPRAGGFVQHYSVASTMDQTHSFTVPGVPLSAGFTTAAKHMQIIENACIQQASRGAKSSRSASQTKPVMGKDQSQRSIGSFFGVPQRQPTSKADENRGLDVKHTLPPFPSQQQRGVLNSPHLQNEGSHTISPSVPRVPDHLARHRLPSGPLGILKRPRPLTDTGSNFHRKKHDLHSSSPPPEARDSESNPHVEETSAPIVAARSDGFKQVLTVQQTTMMKLQSNQYGGTGIGRKTYGVKRSMNGWAERMKRGS